MIGQDDRDWESLRRRLEPIERGVPATAPVKPSEFDVVLAPFVGAQFGTGVGQSFAGIGPMAILAPATM